MTEAINFKDWERHIIGIDYAEQPSMGVVIRFHKTNLSHPLPRREKLLGIWGQEWRFCYYYPMPDGDIWGIYDGQGGIMEVPPPDYWAFVPGAKPE